VFFDSFSHREKARLREKWPFGTYFTDERISLSLRLAQYMPPPSPAGRGRPDPSEALGKPSIPSVVWPSFRAFGAR